MNCMHVQEISEKNVRVPDKNMNSFFNLSNFSMQFEGSLFSLHVHKKYIFYNNAVVPSYPRVIRSKTYRGYVKPNAIYNVISV
jgi:hypothetical protein